MSSSSHAFRSTTSRIADEARFLIGRDAHEVGIEHGCISEIENGKKNVCLPMLEVLAKGFEISVGELMKGPRHINNQLRLSEDGSLAQHSSFGRRQ